MLNPLLVLAAVGAMDVGVTASAPAPASGPAMMSAGSVNGLFPLWEDTGLLHPANSGQIGYGYAQYSLGWLQVGTQPFLDLYGTANLQVKGALRRGQRLSVALQIGTYRVPTAAESRGIGNLNPVALVNTYDPVWAAPVSLATTYAVSPRFQLHLNTTALYTRSSDGIDNQVSLGKSLMAELWATSHWVARVHAGVEGLLVAGRGHAGLSFGYTGERLALSAGYARTMSFDGESGTTIMFDGALLFR